MPKIKDLYLSGKGKYVRMQTIDKFGKWSFQLYLDKPSLSEWKTLKDTYGILNSSKIDEEGEFVRLSRPQKKIFRGVETIMTPPEVLNNEGQPITDWIGNGSDLTAKVLLYSFTKQFGGGQGHAIRLEGIKVHNLVPYSSPDKTPEEAKRSEGLEEAQQPW